jgi:hypothetical protein
MYYTLKNYIWLEINQSECHQDKNGFVDNESGQISEIYA